MIKISKIIIYIKYYSPNPFQIFPNLFNFIVSYILTKYNTKLIQNIKI